MEISLPYNYALRSYQKPAWRYMQGTEEGKRAVCVWHRRAGKDLFAINMIAKKAFERVGTYWHLLPTYKQGRSIVWNGFTREGRKFLDAFPKELVTSVHVNDMRVTFINGSIYQVVGTDDTSSLVGTNPIGCVFSEYSLQDPTAWDYVRPILSENGGWAMFIYTPRSKNHGWRLLNNARKAGWFVDMRGAGSTERTDALGVQHGTKRDGALFIKDPITGDVTVQKEDGSPVVSDQSIDNERKSGMSEEMISQEFYVNFESALEGAYYARELARAEKDKRICKVPYDPKLTVHTAWDIGVGDSTAITFWQEYGLEIRVIDYYENHGEGLPHYKRVLNEKDYNYGTHFAPWDIEVHEFSSGKTRLESARQIGIKFKVTQKHAIEDGIEQVRSVFPRMWIDEEKCERALSAFAAYTKEPLQTKMQRNSSDDGGKSFKDAPVHNWACHAADSLRYMCWNIKRKRLVNEESRKQDTAVDDSDLKRPAFC